MQTKSEIVIYQTPKGDTKIDVLMQDEMVWLSQNQLAELFQTTKQNISLHIKNIYDEGELDVVIAKNYLTDVELDKLNRIVNQYLEFA
jgi:hypothetical protein